MDDLLCDGDWVSFLTNGSGAFADFSSAHFSVVGGDGRAKKFGDCLNRASARFKAIFDLA